jgi:peptidoglycan/xylan/chitin deacetylase (PgdA/CDA1 family)
MRYVTLSFDDGFRDSTLKTVALYERYGLRAEFNVVATYGERNPTAFGDWALWNELQARGHVVQPHGYDHTDKSKVPLAQAQDSIRRCLDAFAENLPGFDPKATVFVFPYNNSTPEIEAWLPGVVRAFRTGHGPCINPLPRPDTVKLTTAGWKDAEEWLDRVVEDLLSRDEGWLIYTAHGLDGEGWGPLRYEYLDALLDRLVRTEDLEILPAQAVLARAATRHGCGRH